ncbi:MAG: N-acetylmuramic acid 6-phosphate etherase [Acidobacteria bacterium]|nr:N-acetylmuramic acid 6-phosphate etherase [Acidobacteriota bacterium]
MNRTPSPPPDSAWARLSTEGRHAESEELDRLPPQRVVELLLDEDRRGLELARREAPAIATAATWMAEALAGEGVVLFVGAGTSGRLGILEAAECPPTFGTDPERIRAELAGGPDAVFRAVEGAEDVEADGAAAAAALGAADLLVAISASSVTPYARGAIAEARRRGARSVLVTCAAREAVSDAADLVIALATGPEVLTGSTRLKAGSATKATLNAISTAAMVGLGKVFENYMVDLRRGSAKLRDRAVRIVAAAGKVERESAERLLAESEGEVKTAIVRARTGLDVASARRRLADAGGRVRAALEG